MSGSLGAVWAIVKKDVISEFRTKEILATMLIFVLLALVIFNFAFDLRLENARQVAPGVLWVAFVFAGILGLNRSFVLETDKGCLEGLMMTPADYSTIYFGKVIGNILFMFVVEAIGLPVFTVLFNVMLLRADVILIVLLGTVGFAGVGTLFSAMSANTRARAVLLPILVFPGVLPAIVAAVKATAGVLDGGTLGSVGNWVALLAGFDIIFLAIAFMTFDFVVES
jgi:heme exporter protein B